MLLQVTYSAIFLTLIFAVSVAIPNPEHRQVLAQTTVQDSGNGKLSKPEVLYDPDLLPEKVADMRNQILMAARSGEIEALRPVLEASELLPVLGDSPVSDPIEFWRTQSSDGHGLEVLAALMEIFNSGFVRINSDTQDELFIWPYFAEFKPDELTPTQWVELYRL
ncbi:MAG: hypothetical protein ACR2OW_13910, partial [Methyloligellaceae bacterium]